MNDKNDKKGDCGFRIGTPTTEEYKAYWARVDAGYYKLNSPSQSTPFSSSEDELSDSFKEVLQEALKGKKKQKEASEKSQREKCDSPIRCATPRKSLNSSEEQSMTEYDSKNLGLAELKDK